MKRKILSLFLACAVSASTMPLTACNGQSVLNDVERFAPVITNVLTLACQFTNSPLCVTGSALLNESEKHLFAVWQGYLDLEKNGTATESAWSVVNAALQDLISKSTDVFALAHIVNATHQKDVLDVAAAAQALLAVIESFLPPAPVKTMAMALPHASRMATFLPAPNPKTKQYDKGWLNAWEKNYNNLPAVKANRMQLHRGFWSSVGNALGEAKFGGN